MEAGEVAGVRWCPNSVAQLLVVAEVDAGRAPGKSCYSNCQTKHDIRHRPTQNAASATAKSYPDCVLLQQTSAPFHISLTKLKSYLHSTDAPLTTHVLSRPPPRCLHRPVIGKHLTVT